MDGVLFDELLALLTPQIVKINTTMCDGIPASHRLSINLRYLATGNVFEDLKFLTAVSPQSYCYGNMHCFDQLPQDIDKGK
ncbi:unnamed protein product [Leptosia nina]|uniref:Uncharacterized protein n=1 Tax=Leptosia nina TaxID=320188 RepID=A0AAV1IZV7_9NEOP